MGENAQDGLRGAGRVDWEDLRHFLALADAGGLSAAARRLGVDHSTVARRVAALEAALGVALLDRAPRAVALTAAGARIAELARPAEAAAQAVRRAAAGAPAGLVGPVRISAPPAYATAVLAPRLGGFVARHPGVALTLAGEVSAADLARRDADIALRMSRPSRPGLAARRVAPLDFALYAAPDHPTDPADWAFISWDDARAEIPQHAWLEAARDGRPVALRTNDASSQAAAAQAGLGAALLPVFLAARLPGLVRLPWDGPLPRRDLWLAVHEDLRAVPRIRAALDFLARLARRVAREDGAAG
ncbi:MAG: LysR family transcriptional regulator [Pseudomonadota bacterium]|nr:LysR family transcriptional regulator [Pseudomonadota bacterium]